MTWTSPTEINWSRGAGEGFSYANTVSNSWFANLILLAIYVLGVWGFYKSKDDFVGGLAVGGILLIVFSFLSFLFDFITWGTFGLSLAIGIISVAPLLIIPRN